MINDCHLVIIPSKDLNKIKQKTNRTKQNKPKMKRIKFFSFSKGDNFAIIRLIVK